MLAVLALVLCELAAGLPGLPASVGLGLAILGYFSFVLLFRWALLSWRRDWEDLWRENLDCRLGQHNYSARSARVIRRSTASRGGTPS